MGRLEAQGTIRPYAAVTGERHHDHRIVENPGLYCCLYVPAYIAQTGDRNGYNEAFLARPARRRSFGLHGGSRSGRRARQDVLIFAAASLKNALDEVAAQWQGETGKKATISYAASSALAKQIEQGAPADIFISADLDWMDYLAAEEPDQAGHRVQPARQPHRAGRAEGLDAADRDRARASTSPALLGDGRLAMANVDAVPAGKYGKAALEKLGVWDSVEDKIAQAENVRAALRSSRAARRRSASSTRPTRPPTRTSRSSAPSPRTASADHLSGRADGRRRRTPMPRPSSTTSQSPARRGHCSRSRASRSWHWAASAPERAQCAEASADGLAATSRRRNGPRSGSACASRLSRCWRACRSASPSPMLLARGALPGQVAPQRPRAPAAGPAAGRHRLLLLLLLRPARADRRLPRRSISASSSPSAGPAPRSPAAVMGFPLMVRAIRLSIEAVDRRLEDAAGTLGANPLWVFLTVTLPLILPGIIAGMILSFAKAMGEFGATITFVSNIPGETQTLPSAIYTFTQVPGGDAGALRLTLVSIVDLDGGAARLRAARRVGAIAPRAWTSHEPRRRHHAPARRLRARRALRQPTGGSRRSSAAPARARPRSSTSSPA